MRFVSVLPELPGRSGTNAGQMPEKDEAKERNTMVHVVPLPKDLY
jgi:hypothetical protein